MEHLRPKGLSKGYFCHNCGGIVGMYGHLDPKTDAFTCDSNPKLVEELILLNREDPRLTKEEKVSFKPDYLCDPPCSYHDALQEQLKETSRQREEIDSLKAQLKNFKERVEFVAGYSSLQADRAWVRMGKVSLEESDVVYTDEWWHQVMDRIRTDLYTTLEKFKKGI